MPCAPGSNPPDATAHPVERIRAEHRTRPIPVLLAEDEPVNQLVASRMLARAGCDVDIAGNGREAVDRCSARDYRIIFMDCQMPDLDGYEATRRIRAAEKPAHHTPIVAMTAHTIHGDRERCLRCGMDDYLPKPLDEDAIAAVCERFAVDPAGGAPLLDRAVLDGIGDPEALREIVNAFIARVREQLPRLGEALDAADRESLDQIAHGLKGSAATVGAPRIERLCDGLCRAARGERHLEAEGLLGDLSVALTDTADAMAAHLEEMRGDAAQGRTDGPQGE